MAYDRPKRGPNVRVEEKLREPTGDPHNVEEPSAFFRGFDNMHSGAFRNSSTGSSENSTGTVSPELKHLAALVKVLAELQFITKGKVDSNGKVELMFCSPEPIVTQEVKPHIEEPVTPQPRVSVVPEPEIRYIELPREHTKRVHRKKRTNSFF